MDNSEYAGVLACINSIIKNTKNLENINFYVLANQLKKIQFPRFEKEIIRKDLEDYPELKSQLEDSISKHNPLKINNISNYARFLLPLIFENIDEGLYMDADMIVNVDIYNILKEIPSKFNICACPNYDFESMKLKMKGIAFNAGIYYWNFKRYRKNLFFEKVLELMQKDRDKMKQNKFGTQPILNIIYYNKVEWINKLWNIIGFGASIEKNYPIEDDVKNGYVYHWTGDKKPWLEDGNFKEFWIKYKVL